MADPKSDPKVEQGKGVRGKGGPDDPDRRDTEARRDAEDRRDLNDDTGPRPGETNPRSETGEGSTLGSRDVLSGGGDYLVPTTEDALGTERIVAPTYDSWTPARVDPDEKDVERAEQVEQDLKKAKARRHKLLTGDKD